MLLCQIWVFAPYKEESKVIHGLPRDPSPLKMNLNIQDRCHTCIIYTILSVDT